MEFENLQKIWDNQSRQNLYVINETAMHQTIERKAQQTEHIAKSTEFISIVVNAIAGLFLIGYNFFNKANLIIYLMATWMLITSVYALIHHFRRIRSQETGSLPVQDSLNQAIKTASKQVNLSMIMRLNIFPIIIFMIWGLANTNSSIILQVVAGIFMLIAFYLSGFEHKFYVRKMRELQMLKKQLEQEPISAGRY